jgi:hypothetical protein
VLKILPKLYALVLGIKIYPCASSASPPLNQLQLSAHTPVPPSLFDTTMSSFARIAPCCPFSLPLSQPASPHTQLPPVRPSISLLLSQL